MEKHRELESATKNPQSTSAFTPAAGRGDQTPAACDDGDLQGVCRMEDEGGPPTPDDGRRTRATTQRVQRANRRPSMRRSLGPTTAGQVMSRSARAVRPDISIKDVAIVMAGEATGVVPVVSANDRLIGLVTNRDIVIRACAGDKSIEDMRVSDAMTDDPAGIRVEQSLAEVLSAMARLQVQRLPVVDDDFRLLGMISLADIARRGDSGLDLRAALAAQSNRRLFSSRVWR